jgi:class 3 adenylate cyclase
MSEPRPKLPLATRLEALTDAMDRPLLGLALFAMVLYLVDISGVPTGRTATAITLLSFVIDTVFVADLVLKLVAQGRAYISTPWFLIDLLSCLPILDTLTNGLFRLRAIRFFRGIRILRFFRGLRVLRALRSIPGFERFSREARAMESGRETHRAINLGMLSLTAAMVITTLLVRQSLERAYLRRVDAAVAEDLSTDRLADLSAGFEPPESGDYLVRQARVDHQPRQVYFDLRAVDRQVDQCEFFLTLGMMFSMAVFIYIMGYHHMDVTESQLRGLLNLALPSQVAEEFVRDPLSYTRKSRMPATVLFMDFVGFTQTCEALASDPDLLSRHLEAAMDRLVGELARHDMIIDKFIGDAVMSFRGGPLVRGTPAEHARRAVWAALDSISALALLNDPYFDRVKIGGASDEDCLIGAFGTSARFSYTILGDGVNLAARLEPACAQCRTQNLFDESTYRLCAAAHHGEFAWRRWGRIRVAGKSEPIQVYEAFDPARLTDTAFIATFHIALEAYEGHEFDRARDFFLLADSQRPGGDEPSRDYVRRCEALLLGGRPVGWEPVFNTHK